MTQPTQYQIDRLYRRTLMQQAPAYVAATDDSGPIHKVQLQIHSTPEIIDDVPFMQMYGIAVHPLPGSDASVMFPTGQRSNPVMIAHNDQRYRPKNLKPGEIKLYTDEGDSLTFNRENKLNLQTKEGTFKGENSLTLDTKQATVKGSEKTTIDSPTTEHTGDVKAHGKVDASGGFFQNGQPIGQGGGGGQGEQGPPGPAGPPGEPGEAATVTVRDTTTGAPGSAAAVTEAPGSTAQNRILDFAIPRGDQGAAGSPGVAGPPGQAATIAVGDTTTGAPGTDASVVNTGTSSGAVLDFVIPRGDQGAQGQEGAIGDPSFAPITQAFTVPPIDGFVTIELEQADWAQVGAAIFVGGMSAIITKIDGNSITVQRIADSVGVPGPEGPPGEQGPQGPPGLPIGVTDGSDAEPGEVGEYISASGSGAVTGDMGWHEATRITLTPGDWDVSGRINYQGAMTSFLVDINTNTSNATGQHPGSWGGSTVMYNPGVAVGPRRYSLSVTTVLYLLYYCAPGGASASFGIWARRMR